MHALLGFLTLLLATALVLAGARRVARAAGVGGRLDLLVAVPVLAAAQIVVTLVYAGAVLGELNILGVVATNAVVSGALLLLLRPASAADRLFPSQRAVAAFARAYPVVTALAVVAVLAIAWRVVLALVLPPYGYDALHYHLPTVIGWIQSHRVSRIQCVRATPA